MAAILWSKWPTRFCLLLAAGLGVWALSFLWQRESYAQPVIDQPERDLGDLRIGADHSVLVRIHIRGDKPCQVISLPRQCGLNGCLGVRTEFKPFRIEPGGVGEIRLDLDIRHPGPFSAGTTIFVDDGRLHKLTCRVHGRAVASAPEASETGNGMR